MLKKFYSKIVSLRFRVIIAIIVIITVIFIAFIGLHYLALIEFEKRQDIKSISTSNSNLVKALEENTWRNLENINDLLDLIKERYEKTGSVSSEQIKRYNAQYKLPLLYISVFDKYGRVIASSNSGYLNRNRSTADFFEKNRVKDNQQMLVTKAVYEKLAAGKETWLFHVSLRLNRGGRFSGVVAAAVDPLYFSRLFQRMRLKSSSTITLVDLEGNILARQMGDSFTAGLNIAGAELYRHIKESPSGAYFALSPVDRVNRLINYNLMTDFPIILIISEKESEILEPFFRRRNHYIWSAVVYSLSLITACFLLIQVINILRKNNERLESRVAERTAELRGAIGDLARSNEELEQFAYVASHDLQEPLRMVSGYVQLLARRYKGKLDSDADEFIDYAVDGATRMQQLINDLLMYSRLSTRKKGFQQIDCNKMIGSVLANLQRAIEESRAEVNVQNLPVIMGDPSQVSVLFQNLIGNSLKYHGSLAPVVNLDVKRDGDEWVFSVSDNGIGIAPEFFDRIFLMFQRLHSRTEFTGTGIGLALCKKIVERHGGRIWVESALGVGSTFFFSIPVRGVEL